MMGKTDPTEYSYVVKNVFILSAFEDEFVPSLFKCRKNMYG